MKINELSYNATGARYGYNGTHEQDLEVNADGNYLSFGDFGYDTRVVMRQNIDPMFAAYPHLSGYATFNNNPIFFSDPTGWEGENDLISGEVLVEANKPTEAEIKEAQAEIAGMIQKEQKFNKSQDNVKDVTNYSIPKSDVDVDRTTLNGNYLFNHYMGHRDLKDKKGKITFIVPPNNEADVPAIGHDRRCRNVDAGSFGILFCEASIGADWKFVKEEMEVASNLKVNFLVRLQAFTAGSVIGILALPKTSLTLLRDRTTDYIWDDYFRSNINKKDGSRVDNLPHPKR